MACIHGAREVRKAIIDDPRVDAIHPMIVWIPMLDTDERQDAQEMSATFGDVRVPQYWDGEKLLGWEVSRSFGVTERAAWDIYLFYPPGAEWTDAGLPPADKGLMQSMAGVLDLKKVMVGTPAQLSELLSAVALDFLRPSGSGGVSPGE